jgi:hypothetical protein
MNDIELLEQAGIDISRTHETLKEVFALPVGLKEVAKLDGMSLYGSDKLNEKFLAALSKSGRTKDLVEKFEVLVKKGDIIPCFLGKGVTHFIYWRIFAPLGERSIMGFYDPLVTNKIYLLIDNNANIFGFTSNDALAVLAIHEMCHKFAHDSPSLFLSRFRSQLTDFYSYYWTHLFQLKENSLSNTVVFDQVNNLFKKCEASHADKELFTNYKTFAKDLVSVIEPMTNLSETEFADIAVKYLEIVAIFLKSINDFINVAHKYRQVLAPLYEAYKYGLGAKNLQTVAIQELLYPSEVICVYSESSKKIGHDIAAALV